MSILQLKWVNTIVTLACILCLACQQDETRQKRVEPATTTQGATPSKQELPTREAVAPEVPKDTSIAQTTDYEKATTAAPDKKVESAPKKETLSEQQSQTKIKSQSKPKPKPAPKKWSKATFLSDTHDFGFIEEGDTIRHTFTFINEGQAPYEIVNVDVSCGCTLPVYPLDPIAPGASGKIDVTYLSENKLGRQRVTIEVMGNAKEKVKTLTMVGVVR